MRTKNGCFDKRSKRAKKFIFGMFKNPKILKNRRPIRYFETRTIWKTDIRSKFIDGHYTMLLVNRNGVNERVYEQCFTIYRCQTKCKSTLNWHLVRMLTTICSHY